MRWTQKGAHSLLQVRTQTLNDDLRSKFSQWYPGMAHTGPLVEGQMSAQLKSVEIALRPDTGFGNGG